MRLSDIFSVAVSKTLVNVDVLPSATHQHEIDGNQALRDFFGTTADHSGQIEWYYFADDMDTRKRSDYFKFYDARRHHPRRTEWRLYYSGNFLIDNSQPGDLLVLAKRKDTGTIYGLIFEDNSTWMRAATKLFNLNELSTQPNLIPEESLEKIDLKFFEKQILLDLNLTEISEEKSDDDAEIVVKRFGHKIPTTSELAGLARELCIWDQDDPDLVLLNWMERESQLFYAVERLIYEPEVRKGFKSIEDFFALANSLANSRKSRRGQSLENQLEALFDMYSLLYERNVLTEEKSKPDFLFPGKIYYHDLSYDPSRLDMLAAKTTCKERWRQILAEAERIPVKHLCTLEASISTDQTDEMARQNVRLVIPETLQSAYTINQKTGMFRVKDFIDYISAKQVSI